MNAQPPKPIPPRPVDVRTIPALAWLADPLHRRFVGWRYTWVVKNGKGKWDKPPLQADGSNASSTDPSTWGSFDEIWACIDQFDGYGVMLTGLPGDKFAAIDYDDVRDPITGAIQPWAEQSIHDSGSYAEVTVSGYGARVLGTAAGINKLHRRCTAHPSGHGSFELYVSCPRYITISGQVINGANALADITPQVRDLEALLSQSATGGQQQQQQQQTTGGQQQTAQIDITSLSPVYVEMLTLGTKGGQPVQKRGPAFLSLVRELHGKGHDFAAVLALLKQHPNGVHAKYGKRLDAEFQRAWDKVVASSKPAPITDAESQAEVERLAQLSELQYQRARSGAAKKLNIPPNGLDRLVRIEREKLTAGDTNGQGKPLELLPPEPWPNPVDGAALLDDLADYFSNHVVLPAGGKDVLALWSVHCHCFHIFEITPRLQLKSTVKQSGKSTVIDLLKPVTPKTIEVETASVAFLFRAIEMAHPTMLLDETDRYVASNPELIAIINGGAKRGGTAARCVGEDNEPRLFDVFAPMALAGISSLPDTIEDRAVTIVMQRRKRDEKIEPIDDGAKQLAERLQQQAARWTADHVDELRAARPDMGELFNRPADRWRPLYAVAEVAGGDWPKRAQEAMEALGGGEGAKSLGERLLVDIKQVFDDRFDELVKVVTKVGGDTTTIKVELTPEQLTKRLIRLPDRPWREMPRSDKALTPNRLSRMLGDFGISTHREWDPQTQTASPRVYRLIDFTEAFARYVDAP
jgi:putative DNA primase/helicase